MTRVTQMTLFKKLLCVFLSAVLVLMTSGCGGQAAGGASDGGNAETHLSMRDIPAVQTEGIEYAKLSDPDLRRYIEDAVYAQLIQDLDSNNYVVERVQTAYVSQEYIDELEYNSKSNIYFGFTLEELESYYQGERYVFTLGEDGHTTTRAFEAFDDTYSRVVRNVATGSGVILVCVTVSAVTAGAGIPAASAIFAVAAETGTTVALSSGAIAGLSAALVTGLETGDAEEALRSAAIAASEGFMWGAIGGALSGGANEAYGLYQATAGGLTMNEVATIQQESGLSLDVISQLNSMEQYEILQEAGSFEGMVNGRTALLREIDLYQVDEMGRTNLERMAQGLAPMDPSGHPYELHHVGQHADSMLAVLTREEHRLGDSYSIWHDIIESEIDRPEFNKQKQAFWKAVAEQLMTAV